MADVTPSGERHLPAEVAAPLYALWLAIDALDTPALLRRDPQLEAGVRAAVTALLGMLGDLDDEAMAQSLDQLALIVGASLRC